MSAWSLRRTASRTTCFGSAPSSVALTGALGKTAITLSGTAVGFSCFSDECADKTSSDLRNKIERLTGRKSKVRFYEGLRAEEWAERLVDLFAPLTAWSRTASSVTVASVPRPHPCLSGAPNGGYGLPLWCH